MLCSVLIILAETLFKLAYELPELESKKPTTRTSCSSSIDSSTLKLSEIQYAPAEMLIMPEHPCRHVMALLCTRDHPHS